MMIMLYKINKYTLFYKVMVWSVTINVFFIFNSSFHFSKMDIKKCPIFIFRFENCKKKSEKMSLQHNALIFIFQK
jgi:hypothetical protein